MSQQQQTVRITTTTTTSSSALVINTGYLKTLPGLLKLVQFVNIFLIWIFFKLFFNLLQNWFKFVFISFLCSAKTKQYRIEKVLGCITVGLIACYFNDHHLSQKTEVFFYAICVTFTICTAILLISCLFSWSTGGIISKTIYVSSKLVQSQSTRSIAI